MPAMATADVEAFFNHLQQEKQRAPGEVVEGLPDFDLERYLDNYAGRTYNERLFHIAKTSPVLCVEALEQLINETLKGPCVHQYRAAWSLIRIAAPKSPLAVFNQAWVDETERNNNDETKKLEAQLKVYKNNLIKDSIRMGNEELGKHLTNIGQYEAASDAFGRMRHDITTTKQIVDCNKHLIEIALRQQDWGLTLSQLNKIKGFGEEDLDAAWIENLKVIPGIAYLGLGQFDDAAKCFLGSIMSQNVQQKNSNLIASINDIATYGGLLSLATMSRTDIQTKVLESKNFKKYLDEEPHISKALTLFVNGRYSACLEVIRKHRDEYLLDLYLHKHVDAIFRLIRKKCIKQYFAPFSVVTLASLEAAFGHPGISIQDEVISMISQGEIDARLDVRAQTLRAVQVDPRTAMQEHVLDTVAKYERDATERLRRLNLVAAGLTISGGKPPGAGKIDEQTMPQEIAVDLM